MGTGRDGQAAIDGFAGDGPAEIAFAANDSFQGEPHFGGGGIQLRPFVAATAEKDFTGDSRTVLFSQTASPTIVNSFAFDDASKHAYGRFSGGFSAAIFKAVSIDVAGSATVGKDQGEETSAQLGLRFGF